MKRALVVILLLVIPVIGIMPMIELENETVIESSGENRLPLIEDTGEKSSVSIRFDRELTTEDIHYYESLGVSFGKSPQHVGSIYIAEASQTILEYLKNDPNFETAEPLRNPKYHTPRDISVPGTETYTELAWNMQDYYGLNLTGKDILIADLDTGIQWRHPDFFFADGGSFSVFDVVPNPPWLFVNGSDGIDLNSNMIISSNETLYSIDVNGNGNTDPDVDWIWLDNGTTTGSIDDGDTFFVVNDTNSDNQFSTGENLIALKTPKTKYIVEKSGSTIQCWGRNNLTSSPHYDTDGHGTGVAGILNGGQLGYRKYVGVAPGAELMAINIFGTNGLTVEEGLIWARDHGADVILIEVGSWTYEYLDGSSNVEMMIDTLTSSGIPVIVPAGNLGGAGRHLDIVGIAGAIQTVNFFVPNSITATELYLTILTPASLANIQVNITEPTSTGTIVHQLTFGNGYYQWITASSTSNVTIQTFASTSTRNTNMLAIDISGTIKHTSSWSLSIKGTDYGTYYCYIADDDSAWSGGAQWTGAHLFHTITWPSTADMAISVASYHTRSLWATAGGIASFSSNGPRIDGAVKLSVTAPGGWDIISAWSSDSIWYPWYDGTGSSGTVPVDDVFGGYRLFSGTSASGPHVAGAAALLLQLNPDCGPIVKHLIEASAYTDGFTGGIPPYPGTANVGWGYGKLNVSAAVEEARKLPIIWEANHTPTYPGYSDTVTVTANISNADYVKFQWTNCSWSAMREFNMTLSSGLYTATIPVHKYGFTIEYKIIPMNSSAIGGPIGSDIYQIVDKVAPVINSFTHNATATVTDPTFIDVAAQVSEPTNASGVWAVDIEFSVDNWASTNYITMTYNGSHWVGTIAPNPAGMTVKFRVAAYDNVMNRAVSSEFTYSVIAPTTTTSTTTTTTTDTTSTTDTTTGTTTGPTGGIPDFIQENMYLIIAVGVILALILIVIICRRR